MGHHADHIARIASPQHCCSPPQPTPAACRRHATPLPGHAAAPTPPTSNTGCSGARERARGTGPLTPLYPGLPGNHAPTGPIEALTGLVISGGDRPIEWQRDPLDMYAFHVAVPRGITRLEISFEFASAATSAQGRRVMTPDLLGLQWEKTLLYPAGHYARRISVAPEVTPAG
jgi:hypothetical protein